MENTLLHDRKVQNKAQYEVDLLQVSVCVVPPSAVSSECGLPRALPLSEDTAFRGHRRPWDDTERERETWRKSKSEGNDIPSS